MNNGNSNNNDQRLEPLPSRVYAYYLTLGRKEVALHCMCMMVQDAIQFNSYTGSKLLMHWGISKDVCGAISGMGRFCSINCRSRSSRWGMQYPMATS